jgi:iron complex transport system permease protein
MIPLGILPPLLLVGAVAFGLACGAVPVSLAAAWSALSGGGDDLASLVVREARLPRVLVGLLVGAGLGGAGAVMQALTRNPLAGPGLMGLNAGAAAALALCVITWPSLGLDVLTFIAAIGAAGGAALVWTIASVIPCGFAPHRLALIGAITSGLLASLTAAIVVASGMQGDLLYWMVGGLGTVGWRELWQIAPACIAGLALAQVLAPALGVAALGVETATALGLAARRTRALAIIAVLALAGAANAAAGPVGFVGLMAPHLARGLIGADERRVLPTAACLGAVLVVAADALGRLAIRPAELPLGVFLALVGGPFLVVLARRRAPEPSP